MNQPAPTETDAQTGLAGIDASPEQDQGGVREQIITSAAARFEQFGYGKTNVAEIAADCGMSPGNLYRYFKNKAEIAEAIMRMAMDKVFSRLAEVAHDETRTACQRLRDYVLEEMRQTFNQLDRYPTLLEQVRDPQAKGPLLADEYIDKSRALLAHILEAGNRSHEFDVDDVVNIADRIQLATYRFRYPQMHILSDLKETSLASLEQEAEGVIDLIIDGIAPR